MPRINSWPFHRLLPAVILLTPVINLTTSLAVPLKFLGANYSGSLLATVAGSYRLIIMQSSKLVLKIPILIEVIPAPEYTVHYSRLIMFSQSVIIGKTFAAHVLFSDSFGNLKPVDLSVLELQIDGENEIAFVSKLGSRAVFDINPRSSGANLVLFAFTTPLVMDC